MLKFTGLILAGLVLLFGVFAAYVRLAPVQTSRWHIDLQTQRPPELVFTLQPPGRDLVQTLPDGAYLDVFAAPEEARALIHRLDAIALGSPRTRRVAGSPQEGHVTWETRSRFWGFPDYTTAQVTPAGLTLYARLRFGLRDSDVNAARLREWIAKL